MIWLLDLLFKKRVIENCEHEPYLARWFVIRSKNFGLFIHKFIRSDEDRALHCHPWDFIVIPVWRGYWEHYEEWMVAIEGVKYFTLRRGVVDLHSAA
jgi:hypothetical protein